MLINRAGVLKSGCVPKRNFCVRTGMGVPMASPRLHTLPSGLLDFSTDLKNGPWGLEPKNSLIRSWIYKI